MKNTLMLLLASLLLAFSLTACGGGSQYGTANRNDGIVSGNDNVIGHSDRSATGSYDGTYDGRRDRTAGDAREDAGRDIRNAAGDVGNAVNRAMDDF